MVGGEERSIDGGQSIVKVLIGRKFLHVRIISILCFFFPLLLLLLLVMADGTSHDDVETLISTLAGS